MKMKRILALVLSLCLILPFGLVRNAFAVEDKTVSSENLTIEKLDGSDYDLDLTKDNVGSSDLALDEESIDAKQAVQVIIVMEGDSIIEEDSSAVLNDETQAKSEALAEAQAEVVAEIEKTVLEGETLEISYSYTWLLNGVAAEVPYGTIEAIKAVDGVKQVLIQPVYNVCKTETNAVASPMTITDGVMIGRESAWANGYTGKGIKIAIIDTGLDIDHQNFAALTEDKLTGDSATADTVAAVLDQLNASKRYEGLTIENVYYSSKVAFGFNYCDDNLNITHDYDSKGDHGTHVSGIAAANKVEGSDVVGVAPDAQLYVMKVFGENGGAYAEDILAALEDALMLGADVVNMSLGTNAGFTTSTDEVNEIYNRVAETNTVLSVSAGNSATSAYGNNWGTDQNLTSNPDNAVIGEPATYTNVLSIASVENLKIQENYIDVDGYQIIYQDDGSYYSLPKLMTLTGEYGIVAVPGTGAEEDYEKLDVTGKVALVQRGTLSFTEKCTNAENAGAVACIIYNNVTEVFGMNLSDCEGSIPCVSITMADGAYLTAQLEANPKLTVSFPKTPLAVPSEDAYQMSDFSSWGVAPDLSLEPDLTAPGGNIYSTINNGEYGLMSGTSMAAPNVSGIAALVMQYVKEDGGSEDCRTMVQSLLMSTSVPLTYEDADELYYSPRSQGSGLANAFNAVNTQSYLTVDGCDVPKAQLGDDADRTGVYSFSFNVTNFSGSAAYYDLNTVVQTEDYVEADGHYFMSSTPKALAAAAAESTDSLVLKYDVDDSGEADSHDAYLIYQAVKGSAADENWTDVSFRYDADGSEAVNTDDVQAYLDALVGNDSNAELDDTVLCVAAGETAQISVSVELTEADKAYFDTYYENGGYVEGFTFLTALNTNGVDLSLPYLGFYGNWNDAPVLDDGSYWDMYAADYDETQVVGSQYVHVLWTNFYGYDSSTMPGLNAYVDEPFDMDHISVSPNGDGYFDTIDDIYTSLLRNAEKLTYRYTNMATGEVYYEQSVENVSKTYYYSSYGQIVPTVYSWLEDEIALYDWTAPDGSDLTNNTKLLLEVVAQGVGETEEEADVWSVPITVDLEAPQLLKAEKLENKDTGEVTLTLTFKDNLSTAAVILADSDGQTPYVISGVEDVEPDENGCQTYTMSFDATGLTGKIMVILSDYALNEAYYGLNMGGEGAPYGDLVSYQYNFETGVNGWVSFDADVNMDEIQITMDDANFVCAEYVGGYVYAQTETGALYGIRYEDMLKDTYDPEICYITTLENVYQDLAYSYVEGQLYGLYTYESYGYPTTEIYSINVNGEYHDEDQWATIAPYQEDWFANRGGVYGLTLAIDDAGTMYVLGTNYDWDTEALTETAHLWKAEREVEESWDGTYVNYYFQDQGDTGISMNYLQSMTWDHNTETLYWARFDADMLETESELYVIDPETAVCTKAGTLSGETCALFAPLTEEAAAKDEHANIPEIDTTVIGTPVLLDETVTMSLYSSKTLSYDLDPWYTDYKDVVWSTSDENIVTVDQNGTITAVAEGTATITVANAADRALYDTVTVNVVALSLNIEGIVSKQGSGIANVADASTYKFTMEQGAASFGTVNTITASDELNYGLSLATSVMGRGYIWASEYGNTGMIYQIDPATGEVVDVLQPVDGGMLFGMTYSESQNTFTGIMNMYLYVDLEMTHEEQEEMLKTYDEETDGFTYHKVNMLPYLLESNTGFITNETGNGASSEIVFCGITTLPGGYFFEDTYKDYMGNWFYGSSVNYIADQTLVLLDNVGRLWYIDEIVGMTKESDEYGNVVYESENGYITHNGEPRNGMFEMENVDAEGNVTYNVFNIRCIEETPLTDMFREGTMPRITYHFSDIEYAGETADGAPMFAMSLYDYWNNGTTNELYLYIPGVGTGEWVMDYNTWDSYEVKTPASLYALGNTGKGNIIASIHSVEVTGGVELPGSEADDTTAETGSVKGLTAGVYGG